MHRRCPLCDLKYDREPGYFIGAMYFSYAISLPTGAVLMLLIWYFTRWELWKIVLATGVLYAPLTPFVVRFSRVLWLHWDRTIDPKD